MRILKLLAAAFLLASPVAAPAGDNKMDDSGVVKVECALGSGSAVRIGHETYISAAHVANQLGCAVNGAPISGVRLSDGKDFAVFTAPDVGRALPVSCKGFKVGKTYLAIGYAFGWDTKTYEPLLATQYHEPDYPYFIGEVIPGMSGGAVVNDSGELVGIVNKRWPARSLPLKDTPICKTSTRR